MKRPTQAIAPVLAVLFSSPSLATNDFILVNPDDFSSLMTIEMSGDRNMLTIDRLAPSGQPAGEISVSLEGEGNGGPEGARFHSFIGNGLMPGALIQHGLANDIEVTVRGTDNLFAIAQTGSANTARAQVTGTANQFVIDQAGTGNFASLIQNGIGNTAIVTQIAW